MAYQDSNPERRNLIVMSMCIIVFYIGDAKIDNQQIRLELLNVTFQNSCTLTILVWGMLGWFLFRYWLLNNSSWRKGWHQEVTTPGNEKSIIYWYLKYLFKLNEDYSQAIFDDRHGLYIAPKENKLVFIHNSKNNGQVVLEALSFLDRTIIAALFIYSFFRYPTLSSYFVPYFLAICAVSLAVYKNV